jgi:hypothetical protein
MIIAAKMSTRSSSRRHEGRPMTVASRLCVFD